MATIWLDVREDLRNGQEPFSKIMAAVSALGAGDKFELLAPFEPVPLYKVMSARGFQHVSEQMHGGDWKVLFWRE